MEINSNIGSIPISNSSNSTHITNSSTIFTPVITVGEALQHQSRPDGWICPLCTHHRGDINCAMNMFISFTGCYTKDCKTFKEK